MSIIICINIFYAIIGASGVDNGAAYIFSYNGSIWTQQTKLIASDSSESNVFGISVDIDNSYVVVGDLNFGDDYNQGAAYTFYFDGSNWSQQAKLSPSKTSPATSGSPPVPGPGPGSASSHWSTRCDRPAH